MEKTRFYYIINEFLTKNFILVLIFLFLFLSVNYQKNPRFEAKGNARNSFVARNYSKSTMATDSVYLERAVEDGAVATNDVVLMKTAGVSQQNSQNNRKIVKNFNLTLIVKDVAAAKNNIELELEKYKGYASNFYSYNLSSGRAINMELKIPSEKVDEYLDLVKKVGYIKSESFSSMDYTEQYNDNANKLKNLYSRRDKLRDMMKMQTKQLTDLLAVDRELNNTQIEIERLEKRNNKIQKDVDFSSVSITIEPEIIENRENMQWSIKKVFVNAVDFLIMFCHTVISYLVFAVVFLPIIVVVFCAIFGIKTICKFIKNRKK